VERLCEIAEALAKNTHLEKLHLANTRATDKVANVCTDIVYFCCHIHLIWLFVYHISLDVSFFRVKDTLCHTSTLVYPVDNRVLCFVQGHTCLRSWHIVSFQIFLGLPAFHL